MTVLPDVLAPGLVTVFCGSAASSASARARAYYAGPGNRFWPTLAEVGLTDRRLRPDEFRALPSYGIGLTDLAKHESGMDRELSSAAYDAGALRARIEACAPRILAFTGRRPAGLFLLEAFGVALGDYGPQETTLGKTQIWVLPSPSGAARRWWSVEPWTRLAALHTKLRKEKDEG